jgi:Na+/citrate or Na+/malate symporter
MNAFYAGVWFFFLLICPVVTVATLIAIASICSNYVQRIVFGMVGVLALTLAIGPAWTEIGPMPWWFSGSNLVNFSNATYLVWQYALVSTALYAVISLVASLIQRTRSI